jgi:carbon-monoxide dehydrogenase large subunit
MALKKFGVGQPLKRVEDKKFITGNGQYLADVQPDRALVAYVLRSPHAHADFDIGDLTTARGMKGVKLILIASDIEHLGDVPCLAALPNKDGSQSFVAHTPVLCKKTVKHVGDAVAFIVAETIDQAKDAAEAIPVHYNDRPAMADLRKAITKGAHHVWEKAPDNLALDTEMGDKAKVDDIFAKADRVIAIDIENNRLITNYMETRGAIGEYDSATKQFTLTISSQGVHGVRDTVAAKCMKISPDKLRVITPDVGGGFGTKTFSYREYPLVLEAAKRLKRPVKWIADRGEHFIGDAQGRDNLARAEVALDKSGKFLAMRFDIVGNLGAYASQYGPYIPYLGATMVTGVYATKHIHVRVRCVYTNTMPVDAYRGAGRPEAAYLLERLVDRVARETGIKPEVIRKKNFITPAQMPYKTPVGDRTYDTGDFAQHMDHAMQSADWNGFKDRVKISKKNGKLRGIGLATYIECTAWGSGEDVEIRLETDGTVTIFSGTQSNGQGHATAYAQFASQHLDLPLDKIRVIQGDTDVVATGNGTGGSRSIPVGGVSTSIAAKNLSEKIKELASGKLEASVKDLEIADGAVRVVGTDKRITFTEIANLPGVTEDKRKASGDFVPPDATYPNGTHIAEVEIDPDTGVTEIVRYTICDDFGIAVNPLLLAGQVHGGIVQGVGQALFERVVFDEQGQLITASFMDYCMPRADNVPSFHFETKNVPSTTNPLGIKGAGEAGSIGSCPAVMNAIVDALDRAYGVRDIDMPATPQRVFEIVTKAKLAAAA